MTHFWSSIGDAFFLPSISDTFLSSISDRNFLSSIIVIVIICGCPSVIHCPLSVIHCHYGCPLSGYSPNSPSEVRRYGISPCSPGGGGSESGRRHANRKLVGMRYLFQPLGEELNLLKKAHIWVARHDHKYFVGWTEEQLQTIDPTLRPITPITADLYKLHMNR